MVRECERGTDPTFDLERPDWQEQTLDDLCAAILHIAYVVALPILHDHADAEDIAQQTFIVFVEKRHQLDSNRTIAPWIAIVARNCSLTLRRKKQTACYGIPLSVCRAPDVAEDSDVLFEDTRPYTLPDEIAERNERAAFVRQAIACLPERFQQVIHLRYGLDMSFHEAAQAMRVNENTAKTWFHRAKLALTGPLRIVL